MVRLAVFWSLWKWHDFAGRGQPHNFSHFSSFNPTNLSSEQSGHFSTVGWSMFPECTVQKEAFSIYCFAFFYNYIFGGFLLPHPVFSGGFFKVHPWNLTWNLKRSPWKRWFLLETIIFRWTMLNFGGVLVNLPSFVVVRSPQGSLPDEPSLVEPLDVKTFKEPTQGDDFGIFH